MLLELEPMWELRSGLGSSPSLMNSVPHASATTCWLLNFHQSVGLAIADALRGCREEEEGFRMIAPS